MAIFLQQTGANGFGTVGGEDAALQGLADGIGGLPAVGAPNRPEVNYVFAKARSYLDAIATGGAAVPDYRVINGLIQLYEGFRGVQAGVANSGAPVAVVAGLNPAADLLGGGATDADKIKKLMQIARAPALEVRGVGVGAVQQCLGRGGSHFSDGILAAAVAKEMKEARQGGLVWHGPSPKLKSRLERQTDAGTDPNQVIPTAYYGTTANGLTAAAVAMGGQFDNPGADFVARDPKRSMAGLEAGVGAFYDAHYAGVGGAPVNFLAYLDADKVACKDAAIEFLEALRSNPTMKMAPSVNPGYGGAAAAAVPADMAAYGISTHEYGRMTAAGELNWGNRAEVLAASRLRAATRALFEQHGGLARAYIREMSRAAGRVITEDELCHLGALAGVDLARGGAGAGIVDAHVAAVPVNTADVAGAPNPVNFAAALGEGLSSHTQTANRATGAGAQDFDGGGIDVGALTAIVADMDGVRSGAHLSDLPSYGVGAERDEFPTFDAALVAGAAGRVGGAAVTDITIMNTQLSLVADALEECRRVKGARIAHGAPTCASDSRVVATVTALCQPGNEIAKNIFVDWVNTNNAIVPPLKVEDLNPASLNTVIAPPAGVAGPGGQTFFQRIVARASGRDDSIAAAGAAAGNVVPLIMREDPYLTAMHEFDLRAKQGERLSASERSADLAGLRMITAGCQARMLYKEVEDFLKNECAIADLPLGSAVAVCDYISGNATDMPAGLGTNTERRVARAKHKWGQICVGQQPLGDYGHVDTTDPSDLKILQQGMEAYRNGLESLQGGEDLSLDKQTRELERNFKESAENARIELEEAIAKEAYESAKRRVNERRWRDRGVHTKSDVRAYHAKESASNWATIGAAVTALAVLLLIGAAIAGAPVAAGFVAAASAGEAFGFIMTVFGMGAVTTAGLAIVGAAKGATIDGNAAIDAGKYGDASSDRVVDAQRAKLELERRLKGVEQYVEKEYGKDRDSKKLEHDARSFHRSMSRPSMSSVSTADLDLAGIDKAVTDLRVAAEDAKKTYSQRAAGTGADGAKQAADGARIDLAGKIVKEGRSP